MKRFLTALACGLVIVITMIDAAPADSVSKTAAANNVLSLDHFASVNPDCTSKGRTVVRVLNPPAHGSIAMREGRSFSYFSGLPNCNTRKVEGVTAIYRPERGFVGSDAVGLQILFPSGNEWQRNYTISVK